MSSSAAAAGLFPPSRASNRLTAPQNPAGAVKQRDHFWAAA